MGKIFDQYFSEYEEAIAPGKAMGHKYVVRPECWIAAKWQGDNNLFPWYSGYQARLIKLAEEDPEMAMAVCIGTSVMMETAEESLPKNLTPEEAFAINAQFSEKLTFEKIREFVIEAGFNVEPFEFKGHRCGMSRGIEKAIFSSSISITEVHKALDRFFAGDWGTFYEPGEYICHGHEYGQYPSSLGSEPHNGSIMIHREPNPVFPWDVVVYFQFER